MKTPRLGVVGVGHIGKNHARLYAELPGAKFTAIFDTDRVVAQEREAIVVGQGILVIEAMKMQNEIRSPKSGKLLKLLARAGSTVNAGELLAIVE